MKQDKIWDYYQNKKDKAFVSCSGRLDFVSKFVTNGRVLTIGVGNMYLESLLINKPGIDLFVLDPSETSITNARETLNLTVLTSKVGYSQNIPYDDSAFDFVIMSEVLEHLEDDVLSKTLNEVHRVLDVGGFFIGTVPYNEDLSKSKIICPNCECVFHKVGHVQSFTKESLIKVIDDVFGVGAAKVKIIFLPAWNILNKRGKVVAITKKVLEFFGVHSGKSNLFFRVQK